MKRVLLCLAIPLSATAPLIPHAVHEELEVDSDAEFEKRKRAYQGRGCQSIVSKLPSRQIVCWLTLKSIDNTLARTDAATTQNNLDAIAQVEQAISKLGARNKFVQEYQNFWDAELKTLQHRPLGWNQVNDFIRDVRAGFFSLTTSRMLSATAPAEGHDTQLSPLPQPELQEFQKTLESSSSFSEMALAMHKKALALAIHSESLYQEHHTAQLLKDIDRVGKSVQTI